ncbi:MAG TPA: hypothetical protein VFT67_10850 [Jatrophihabitantaceae bacterium]|nr:hypothetical protein [Jatrophihabitantaceae bacterium]
MSRTARIAAAGALGALIVAPLGAASADAATTHGHHAGAHHVAISRHVKTHHVGGGKHRGAVRHSARFTATGTVTAVDTTGQTVTLADRGGSRDLHGTSVTITAAATATIELDDATATLADVQVGDHVAAHGTRADGPVFTATRVAADSATDQGCTDQGTDDQGTDDQGCDSNAG